MRLLILAFLIANALPLFSQKELYLGVDLNPQVLINNQDLYYDLWDGKTNQILLGYGIKAGGIFNERWDVSIGINFQKRESGKHSVLYPFPDSLCMRCLIPKLYYFEDDQIEGNHLLSTDIYLYNFPLSLKYTIKQKSKYSIFLNFAWIPEFEGRRTLIFDPIDSNEDAISLKGNYSDNIIEWKSHSLGIGMYKKMTNRIRSRFAINFLSRDFKYNLVRVSGEIGLDFIFLKKK